MEQMTLKIALEYQRKPKTIGEFKANGRELCEKYGLTVQEALSVMRGDNGWLDIVAEKEEAQK